MKKLFLILSCCASSAFAQSVGSDLMPDGSKDMYVGLRISTTPHYAKLSDEWTSLTPLLKIEWSSGLFMYGNELGMKLSSTPGIEYGPLLGYQNGRAPADDWRLRGSETIAGTFNPGAFINIDLGAQLHLTSSLYYLHSVNGLQLFTGLQKTFAEIAPHHSVTLSAGLMLANRATMQQQYGINHAAAAAAGVERDNYAPGGGLVNASVGANWNWALSSSWMVNSGVALRRLGRDAADSPIVGRRNLITYSTGLGYRF